ncbi:hydroxyethylthiazole kinase [Enterococcus faecalis]|uniref:hydroxyethylthiazole kinase n=1 Tax=Enterococcus faecalis TaxID=1351 RepID=UPI0030C8CC3F
MKTSVKFETIFPLTTAPLIQCITNEITCESMANALLYIDAKPIMADDPREFPQLFQQTSALVLNLGHLSQEREQSLLAASDYARQVTKPIVVDLVGYGASDIRNEVGEKLVHNQPTVVKGNLSEMRTFCQLVSHGRGVDGSPLDQSEEAIEELIQALRQQTQKFPQTVFLATGIQDVLVNQEQVIVLQNGVPELDCFTGTGDLVGALVAALLGEGNAPMTAAVAAVSYFNLCGEKAKTKSQGLADFRQNTLNQLSLLMKEKDWFEAVKGRVL